MKTKAKACSKTVLLASALFLSALSIYAQVPAFPGAEGGGAESVGGRGGKVLEVTSLGDNPSNPQPGTFRWAVTRDYPRTVVFRVAGIIDLKAMIRITTPYLTIAGQTAPGGGILLRGTDIVITDKETKSPFGGNLITIENTNDIIIQYLKLRLGKSNTYGPSEYAKYKQTGDCLFVYKSSDVIIDHCSVSWSNDENISVQDCKNVSLTNTISSEGLAYNHFSAGFIALGGNPEDDKFLTVAKNLFAQNLARNPYIKTKNAQIINNLLYVNGGCSSCYPTQISGGIDVDVVNNIYKGQPFPNDKFILYAYNTGATTWDNGVSGDPSIYITGNKGPEHEDPTADNWSNLIKWTYEKGRNEDAPPKDRSTCERFQLLGGYAYPVDVLDVNTLENTLLASVGASRRLNEQGQWIANRDAVDLRIIRDYRNGDGRAPTNGVDETDLGGFPTIPQGTAYVDADQDGMPNTWENKHGFNASDSNDNNKDFDNDGYTNLEEFLNGTNPANGGSTGTSFWAENFSLSNGTTSDNGPTAWTASRSGSFEVNNNRFRTTGTGGEGTWTSEQIDISGASSVNISANIESDGVLEASDYIKVYYKVDGGSEQLIAERSDNFNENNAITVSKSSISGNTVQVVVRILTTGNDEAYFLDNVKVEGTESSSSCSGSAITLQAERFNAQSGIETYDSNIGYCDDGDWVRFDNVDLGAGGKNELRVRYAKGNTSDTRIEMRLGSVTGSKIAELNTTNSGGWGSANYREETATISGGTGSQDVYVIFEGGAGVGNFDWFKLECSSASAKQTLAAKSNLPAFENPTVESPTIQVYPNPGTDGVFQLRLPASSQVQVLDVAGKVVYEHRHGLGESRLDLSDLRNGLYMLLVEGERFKLLKE